MTRRIVRVLLSVALVGLLSLAVWGQEPEIVEVAIALDTSGSMEALIDTARLKLWEIVHELSLMKPTPTLRVALLTYGNGKNDPRAGWVRVETDLTGYLDVVYERLFVLESKGGTEYVARVLQVALEDLDWTPSEDALKLIFVVGNERADQDPQVNLYDVTAAARSEGIFIHAIFVGQPSHEHAASWQELAQATDGEFSTIDPRAGASVMKTPFDQELAQLSAALNTTYIPLGERGNERLESLTLQDENAEQLSPAAAASRAQVKTGPLYAADWDLVEAVAAGRVDLEAIDEQELPAAMREMPVEERERYVEQMEVQREDLRQRIAELSRERQRHVAQQTKEKGIDDSRTLDAVVRKAIRVNAEEKGFQSRER